MTGTILGRNSREGRAFIGIDERNPQTYSAGATLANGALLAEIQRDYVVLERDGQQVRLYAQTVRSHPMSRSDILLVAAPESFKPAKSTNTEAYTEFLRPNPVYEGDRLVGYEVYPGRANGVFTTLGLKPGDVITEIDGQPVIDPESTLGVLAELTNGVSLSARVRRGGKSEQITLDGAIVMRELERTSTHATMAAPPAGIVPTS